MMPSAGYIPKCHSHYDCLCVLLGYYTHISTLADVQENVMEYLHVLSRPMVINHDHDIIWTEAYMDSVVSWSFYMEKVVLLSQTFIIWCYFITSIILPCHPFSSQSSYQIQPRYTLLFFIVEQSKYKIVR